MIKKRLVGIIITLVLLPFLFNCSTTFDEDRFIIIDVNFTLQPVNETNRLWAVVFLMPDWTSELFRFSSASNRIIIPFFKTFNISDMVGYVAVVYDSTGTGVLTGERCLGFNDNPPPPPATNVLSPIAFLEIKTLMLSIDLDSANAGPFP